MGLSDKFKYFVVSLFIMEFKEVLQKVLEKGKFLDRLEIFCFASLDGNLHLDDGFLVEHKGFDKEMNYLFGNDEFVNKYGGDVFKRIKKILKEMGYDDDLESYKAYTVKNHPLILFNDVHDFVVVVAPIVES